MRIRTRAYVRPHVRARTRPFFFPRLLCFLPVSYRLVTMTTTHECQCENYDGERLCPFCEANRQKPTFANIIVFSDGTANIDPMTGSDKWKHLKGVIFDDVFWAMRALRNEGLTHAVTMYL